MAVRGGGGHHNVSDFGNRARKEVMESSNLVMEKSWNSVFKFLWEPCYLSLFFVIFIIHMRSCNAL